MKSLTKHLFALAIVTFLLSLTTISVGSIPVIDQVINNSKTNFTNEITETYKNIFCYIKVKGHGVLTQTEGKIFYPTLEWNVKTNSPVPLTSVGGVGGSKVTTKESHGTANFFFGKVTSEPVKEDISSIEISGFALYLQLDITK